MPQPNAKSGLAHVPDFDRLTRPLMDAHLTALKVVTNFAEQECKAFKQRIKAQDFVSFENEPLDPEYKRRKVSLGRDPRVMISTKHYVDGIHVMTIEESNGNARLKVGFDDHQMSHDIYDRPTSTPLYAVAAYNEHGADKVNLPARPHWRPFAKEMKQRAKDVRTVIGLRVMDGVKKAAALLSRVSRARKR